MTAELRERLEQLVRPYHLSDWELEEYADVVGELPAEARRRVLDLVPSIWPVSHALTFSFLRNAAKGLATFGETRLQIWVGAILEAYEAGGLEEAQPVIADGGFNDVLAHATLQGRAPECITVIGVQPEVLDDFGGSLRPSVRARLPEAVALGARELASWGLAGRARAPGEACEPLNDGALALDAYEAGRPSEEDACRVGDPRLLARVKSAGDA